MAPAFFGRNERLREDFLEQAFLLQYHLNMSYSDVRSLPLPYRRWFIERLAGEFKRQSDERKKVSDNRKGLQDIPMGDMAKVMSDMEAKAARENTTKFKK